MQEFSLCHKFNLAVFVATLLPVDRTLVDAQLESTVEIFNFK